MEEKDINMDIEIAQRAVHDIEFRMSKEFAMWMEDKQNRDIFNDMLDIREAMMNIDGCKAPNVDEALHRIIPEKGRKSIRINHPHFTRTWLTIAALFIITFSISFYTIYRIEDRQMNTQTILPAVKTDNHITLSINNGKALNISDPNQQLSEEGVLLSDSSMSYRQESTEKVAYHTLTIPRGQIFKLELEDGTIVWINAESRLSYPNRFTGKERRVSIEGEAYFQVAKDASRPFIVKTGSVETQVLGTEFNVHAYNNEEKHITLTKGSIRVSSGNGKFKQTLTPGQHAAIDSESQNIHVSSVDVLEYTAWKDNLFCFRNKELIDIMKEIGRWYNKEIVFSNQRSMHYHFNFWADKTAALNNTVQMLNEVGKVKTEIVDDRLIIH